METVSETDPRICVDPDEIAQAAKTVRKFVTSRPELSQLRWSVLQALCSLAQSATRAGTPPWFPVKIADEMMREKLTKKAQLWAKEDEEARKRVSSHFNDLDLALTEITKPGGSLRKELEENKYRWLP